LKNKLAIVGCATHTRDDVNYDDPDLDIWVFNESCSKEWCKRADAVLQLHTETVWKNPLNRGDKEHGEWLMSGNTPPVYMLEKYPEVPNSIKFPKDEIVEALLPTFTVDSERGRKDFFTSTIAYAIALATYLGYKEIHTYGIELADEDEYREQQPCAMFWMGIAVGKGVKLVSHSQMFDSPLYPVETFIWLEKKIFSEQVTTLEPERKKLQEDYIKLKDISIDWMKKFENGVNCKDEMLKAIWARANAGQQFGIVDGASQENERYFQRSNAMEKATGTYVFSKHEFNRDRTAMGVEREKMFNQLNAAAAECERIIKRIEPKIFDSKRRHSFKDLEEAVEMYVRIAVKTGMYTGAMNEDERFMNLIDEAKKAGGVTSQ
jgi:hypothetical protein